MLCRSNFGVRNWPLVLVPGVNPFGRPELRCSGQCGDLNPLNPTRSTQCPAQNPKSSCISSFLASLLISALRLLAHLGPAPPRSSRPCASLLISALRLLAHLGPAPPRPFLRLAAISPLCLALNSPAPGNLLSLSLSAFPIGPAPQRHFSPSVLQPPLGSFLSLNSETQSAPAPRTNGISAARLARTESKVEALG